MARKFSAYLSVYDDWDILPAALRSVAGHVDELVVVDGCYDWMAPALAGLGRNPERSDPRVYAAIEASGIPFRVIARTWANEVEKRCHGYAACQHDHVFRIDADEVLLFDDTALEQALSDGAAVGEMEMPIYIAPGWITRAAQRDTIERQGLLFDRRRISAEMHLNYLWLILTVDQRPLEGSKPFAVHPRPVAFNAHLTLWRSPQCAGQRAAFYALNWMRQHGVPWLPTLRDRPLADTRALFGQVAPEDFFSSMALGATALGMAEAPERRAFQASPLDAAQEAAFAPLHAGFLGSLAAVNRQAVVEDRRFLACLPSVLDLSSPAARDAAVRDGAVTLRLSGRVQAARARLLSYATSAPHIEARALELQRDGHALRIALPPRGEREMLREALEFLVWLDDPALSHRFRIVA